MSDDQIHRNGVSLGQIHRNGVSHGRIHRSGVSHGRIHRNGLSRAPILHNGASRAQILLRNGASRALIRPKEVSHEKDRLNLRDRTTIIMNRPRGVQSPVSNHDLNLVTNRPSGQSRHRATIHHPATIPRRATIRQRAMIHLRVTIHRLATIHHRGRIPLHVQSLRRDRSVPIDPVASVGSKKLWSAAT